MEQKQSLAARYTKRAGGGRSRNLLKKGVAGIIISRGGADLGAVSSEGKRSGKRKVSVNTKKRAAQNKREKRNITEAHVSKEEVAKIARLERDAMLKRTLGSSKDQGTPISRQGGEGGADPESLVEIKKMLPAPFTRERGQNMLANKKGGERLHCKRNERVSTQSSGYK